MWKGARSILTGRWDIQMGKIDQADCKYVSSLGMNIPYSYIFSKKSLLKNDRYTNTTKIWFSFKKTNAWISLDCVGLWCFHEKQQHSEMISQSSLWDFETSSGEVTDLHRLSTSYSILSKCPHHSYPVDLFVGEWEDWYQWDRSKNSKLSCKLHEWVKAI